MLDNVIYLFDSSRVSAVFRVKWLLLWSTSYMHRVIVVQGYGGNGEAEQREQEEIHAMQCD